MRTMGRITLSMQFALSQIQPLTLSQIQNPFHVVCPFHAVCPQSHPKPSAKQYMHQEAVPNPNPETLIPERHQEAVPNPNPETLNPEPAGEPL